jgi:hypothetical protein
VTFDDDMIRLNLSVGSPTIPLVRLGLSWPPPERLYLGDGGAIREATPDDDERYVLRRVSMSQFTDEQRASMTHVFRGAEYEYVRTLT